MRVQAGVPSGVGIAMSSSSRVIQAILDKNAAPEGYKASDAQQLGFLIRDVLPVLRAVCAGFTYDPGHSDLDDEQHITVRMTLGEYRRASRLKYELEKADGH
jgi:hypothetical protein